MIEALEQGNRLRVIGSRVLPATTLRVTAGVVENICTFQSEQDATASSLWDIPNETSFKLLCCPPARLDSFLRHKGGGGGL